MTSLQSNEANPEPLDKIIQTLNAFVIPPPPENPDDVPLDDDSTTDLIPAGSTKFEGAEHRAIGDAVRLMDIKGNDLDASTYALQKIGSIDLTFGRIISLAGDFYTNRTNIGWFYNDYAPICGAYFNPPPGTAEDRFNDMVNALTTDAAGYLKPIAQALDQEKAELDQKKGVDGGSAAQTYHTDPIIVKEDDVFAKKSEYVYAIIAWQNADHFGADAVFCYKVGHALACNAAVKAGMASSDAEKTKLLNVAYFIEACSLHYLTDLFSSGHMRAPRRAFHLDNRKSMGIAGYYDIPVWDVQCRMMHDDDSSTGLLCSNANGDSWVAFGDKQLFMPGSGPNRARVIYTVQQSVKEVFSYFQKPKGDGGQARKVLSSSSFVALNLIPVMTPSLSTAPNWANTVMNNPAPLWVADKQNDPSTTQPWRYRKQLNNHAAYTLQPGHPGYNDENSITNNDPTPEAKNISTADFRGDDQFPATATVTPAAGFIQLTQTGNTWQNANDYNDWVYMNIWNPIHFKADTNIPSTTTLRSRNYIQFEKDARATPILHTLGFFDGSKTAVTILRQQVSNAGGSGQVTQAKASCVDVQDPNQGKSSQWDYEAGVSQSRINISTRWADKVVFLQKAGLDLKDLRCFVLSGGSLQQPIMITAMADASNVYYGRTYLTDGANVNGTVAVTPWTQKSSSDPEWANRPFLKSWSTARDTSKRQILFCRHSAIVGNKFNWHVAALQITGLDGKEDIKWVPSLVWGNDVSLRCPTSDPYAKVRSSCFLVGDIIGAKTWPIGQAGNQCDQVASVTVSPTYLQVDVIGWREGGTASSVCEHDCADDLQKGPAGPYRGEGYLRDYILALVPSQYGPSAGLDILHVSLHKANNKYWLKFKTHVNDRYMRNGGSRPGKNDYYGSCNTSWVEDTFMSKERYESGRYQSLKWLFVPHAEISTDRNAVMEIFSWYGVLGIRYFSAKWDGKNYQYYQAGVQPFNGQTSGTVGRGMCETWGEGFMTWGISEGFADVNYYNMVPGGVTGHGYWDSARQDPSKWTDQGPAGALWVRESDYVRGGPGYVTKLEA